MRLFLALLLLLPTLALAQSPLGDRIGPDLSPEEQRYFGLFPGIEGIQSVQVVAGTDTTRLVVSRAVGGDTTYALRPGQIDALRTFVGSFEQSAAAFLNPNWQQASSAYTSSVLSAEEYQAVRDSVAQARESLLRPERAGATNALAGRVLDPSTDVPFVNPERRTVVIRRGDRILSGVILKADADQLLLHPVAPYNWRAPEAVAIPATEIEWVEIEPVAEEGIARAFPYIGGAVGLAVAGGDVFLLEGGLESAPFVPLFAAVGSILAERLLPRPPPRGGYASRLGSLANRSAFRDVTPLDFPGATAGEDVLSSRSARADGAFSRWRARYGWVNVAAMRGVSSDAEVSGVVQESVRLGGIPTDTSPQFLQGASAPLASVDVALRPVPWVRLGGTWVRGEDERPSLERESIEEVTGPEVGFVSLGSFRGYAELVLPSPRVSGFGLEAAIGGGLTTIEGSVDRSTTAAGGEVAYSLSSSRSSPFVQATVEIVAPRRTSFFVRWTSVAAPEAISIPGAELESEQFPGVITYQREPHEVTFGRYQDIAWGTRFRF
ncbi:hypothetical protein [Rubricoccus marinus]|uniref:Uncharacterized protein n=1 Tax=Rubricoccus marinus TaxID=716817 RepID=A0A259TVA3_9BACT|nr:hypothetical protein [Rubricoccus marinus]OZC01630.1 hypothetical protein BSZ36_00710 [Rubricoccus marinus]